MTKELDLSSIYREITEKPELYLSEVLIGSSRYEVFADKQLSFESPISMAFRDALLKWCRHGLFDQRDVLLLGIDPAINALAIGENSNSIHIVEENQELASAHTYNILANNPSTQFAVTINDVEETILNKQEFDGIAVLHYAQQSNVVLSDDNETTPILEMDNIYGLKKYRNTLNALRTVASADTECIMLLNESLPVGRFFEMLNETGWLIRERQVNLVQQDLKTDISWMRLIQKEINFLDKDNMPITFIEAYGAMVSSLEQADGVIEDARHIMKTKERDVRHRVGIYRLIPNMNY